MTLKSICCMSHLDQDTSRLNNCRVFEPAEMRSLGLNTQHSQLHRYLGFKSKCVGTTLRKVNKFSCTICFDA